MSAHVERAEFAKNLEPFGLLTEGAAGVAVIGTGGRRACRRFQPCLASIAAIVIGGGLMVQAMNSAAEQFRPQVAPATGRSDAADRAQR